MPADTRTTGPQNAFKTVPSRLNDSRHCAIHQSISDSAPFFLTARTKAFTVMGNQPPSGRRSNAQTPPQQRVALDSDAFLRPRKAKVKALGSRKSLYTITSVILQQVHLQQPCYDFCFLQQKNIAKIRQNYGKPSFISLCLYHYVIGSNDGRCVQMAGTQSVQADDLRLLGIPRLRQTVAITGSQHDNGLRDYSILLKTGKPLLVKRTPPKGQRAHFRCQCRARAAQGI